MLRCFVVYCDGIDDVMRQLLAKRTRIAQMIMIYSVFYRQCFVVVVLNFVNVQREFQSLICIFLVLVLKIKKFSFVFKVINFRQIKRTNQYLENK